MPESKNVECLKCDKILLFWSYISFVIDLKNSYVDVFNPTDKPNGPTMPIPDVINSAPGLQMNFFVPQPITDPNAPLDFLTPGGVPHLPEQQVG